MSSIIAVPIPALMGSRVRVEELFNEYTADDLSDKIVEVNFQNTQSIIQGACDEIVRQLIRRKASRVFFLFASARTQTHLVRARTLRQEQGSFICDFN